MKNEKLPDEKFRKLCCRPLPTRIPMQLFTNMVKNTKDNKKYKVFFNDSGEFVEEEKTVGEEE